MRGGDAVEDFQKRKPLRLRGYDYRAAGYYFITICTAAHGEECLSTLSPAPSSPAPPAPPALTAWGIAVERAIRAIPAHYAHVAVDAYVIMPDHVHLLLAFQTPPTAAASPGEDGRQVAAPTGAVGAMINRPLAASPTTAPPAVAPPAAASPGEDGRQIAAPTANLSTVIQQFKRAVSRELSCSIWQKGYYDHIIRSDEDLQNARRYIQNNPLKWLLDRE